MPGGSVERLQPPIVEDEKIGAAQVAKNAGMMPIAVRQRKFFEELGHAVVAHRPVIATGLVAERRGQPALADARANRR